MAKDNDLNKAIDAAKNKLKEAAIEIGKDVADKLKNKAINVGNDAIERLGNKATAFVAGATGPANKYPEADDEIDHKNIVAAKGINVRNNMTSEEEDSFLRNISSNLAQVSLKAIKDPAQAAQVVSTLVQTAGEVNKFCELQVTKRAAIESARQQALARIDAQKTLLMTYLEKTFDERKDLFGKYFNIVDDALKKGNMQQLGMVLNNINDLAASSPFKVLVSIDNIGKALKDPNTEWDF